MIKSIIKWMSESNRYKHLLYAIIIGFFAESYYSANYCGVFCAGGMELKDKLWGGKPDNVDFIITLIGFNIGYTIQILVKYLWEKL